MTALAEQLERLGYVGLFHALQPGDERVWAGGRAASELRAIAGDTDRTDELRLLAAEVLFRHDRRFPPSGARESLAALYSRALRTTVTGNAWGLPGQFDADLADHMARLGDPVLAALAPLLDDDRTVPYAGSEESTTAERLQIRVKDLAAHIVARALGVEWAPPPDPELRDRQISALLADRPPPRSLTARSWSPSRRRAPRAG